MNLSLFTKILLILQIWLLAFVNFTLAQEIEPINSIFWEVSGNGISKPTYIFGTHHLHGYEFIQKNEKVHEILKSVDTVIGEIVIDNNDTSIWLKLSFAMMMKDNTLDKILSKADYEATDKCLRDLMGISLTTFRNFKPISVYQFIMVARYMKAHQKESSMQGIGNSMDGYFQQKAKELKKEVKGLETVDEQLKVLYEGYSLERQVEMLMEMVYDKDSLTSREVVELTDLYNKQDLTELLKIMNKSTKTDELKLLLDDRNNKWIPQIENVLKNGKSAFIAVGAGHLPGASGVITQLKKKGYTLTPIPIKIE